MIDVSYKWCIIVQYVCEFSFYDVIFWYIYWRRQIKTTTTYPGEFSHCKDMSFAEDHLLVAFSKEIGDPSFGILISKPDGQNKKVICLNPTPITSVSFCWGKVIFWCPNDHQVVSLNGSNLGFIAGSGLSDYARGSALRSSLHQPIDLCVEDETVFIADC